MKVEQQLAALDREIYGLVNALDSSFDRLAALETTIEYVEKLGDR